MIRTGRSSLLRTHICYTRIDPDMYLTGYFNYFIKILTFCFSFCDKMCKKMELIVTFIAILELIAV